jgi:hypothetical protein
MGHDRFATSSYRKQSTVWSFTMPTDRTGRLAKHLGEQEVLLRRAETEIGRLERRLSELVATEKEIM